MSMIEGQGLQDAGTANDNQTTNGDGQGTVQENGSQPEAQQQQQQTTNPFLNGVDEADRAIVQKYIDKWDANVQRRMMEQARQFEPYKNLGDIEQLQRAAQLYDYFQRNPQEVYQKLHAAFGQQQQQQGPQLQPQPGQGFDGYPEEFAPYFQQFDQKFGQFDTRFNEFQRQTTQILESLANYVIEQNKTTQEREEDAALEQTLNLLKQEFGEFDEEYVLTKMYAGMDPAAAVQDWNSKIQGRINATRTPAPGPTLSGGGGTPPQSRRVEDLSKKETINLVASVLEQAAKSGG